MAQDVYKILYWSFNIQLILKLTTIKLSEHPKLNKYAKSN